LFLKESLLESESLRKILQEYCLKSSLPTQEPQASVEGALARTGVLCHYRKAKRSSAEDAGSNIDMHTGALAGGPVLLDCSQRRLQVY
jgi:hypothetical protein